MQWGRIYLEKFPNKCRRFVPIFFESFGIEKWPFVKNSPSAISPNMYFSPRLLTEPFSKTPLKIYAPSLWPGERAELRVCESANESASRLQIQWKRGWSEEWSVSLFSLWVNPARNVTCVTRSQHQPVCAEMRYKLKIGLSLPFSLEENNIKKFDKVKLACHCHSLLGSASGGEWHQNIKIWQMNCSSGITMRMFNLIIIRWTRIAVELG